MTKNMGTVDRVVRIIIGLGVAILYFTGSISEQTAMVFGVVAAVLLISSAAGFCPLYMRCKINTLGK